MMIIDCDACAARGPACGDCIVTVLLGAPPAVHGVEGTGTDAIDLDRREQAAIAVLAGSGLVPPLRLVPLPSPTAAGAQVRGDHDGTGDEADGTIGPYQEAKHRHAG